MFNRSPFFHFLTPKTPMNGLISHYKKLSECMYILRDALRCYVDHTGICRQFLDLARDLELLQEDAEKIRRNVSDHLPHRFLMAVDKPLFIRYAALQDDILASARDALHWLSLRPLDLPGNCLEPVKSMMDELSATVEQLEPALRVTIGLVHGEHKRRSECKERYGRIQQRCSTVQERRRRLVADVYDSDLDFRSVYQCMRFLDCLGLMAQRCEECAQALRSMIAR
jgi:hypothetical protein